MTGEEAKVFWTDADVKGEGTAGTVEVTGLCEVGRGAGRAREVERVGCGRGAGPLRPEEEEEEKEEEEVVTGNKEGAANVGGR